MTNTDRKTKGIPDATDKYVGERLRELRKISSMSQEALADAIGITFQQVQKYEKGTNRIAAGRLYRIMLHFKVSADYFFPDFPDVHPPITHTQMQILKYYKCANDDDLPAIRLAAQLVKKVT